MADQFNDSIPAAANTILADIADMAETFGWLKDCFQHICNGFSNTVLTSLGHVRHVWVPAVQMAAAVTDGATWNAGAEYGTNDVTHSFFAFNAATKQYVMFDHVMAPGWNRGTIKAKFYWTTNTGSSAGHTVEWELTGFALSNHDAIDQAYGTEQVISDAVTADNGQDLHVSDATPAITIGGTPALGDMVQFRVARNVGGTDDCPVAARLFGVLLEITETFPDASGTNAIATW